MSGQGKGTSANQTNRYSATFAAVLGIGPAWSVDSVSVNGIIFGYTDFNVVTLPGVDFFSLDCGTFGTAKFYLGTETQPINAALAAEETTDNKGHSAYRGWVYLVLENFNFGAHGETNPPDIQVLWRRLPHQTIISNLNGSASNDGAFTANPVAVTAELLTSWDWAGLDASKINAETFQTTADSIELERATGDTRSFAAISPLWSNQTDLKSALADISSVSGAWLRYGVDGRIEAGRWVRGGSAGTVTLLGPHDLTEPPEIKVADSDNLPNSFTVEFTDAAKYHKQGATTPANGASVRTTGVVRNQTVQRPLLLLYDQAQRHAMDLLRENSIPAVTFEGRVRRSKCMSPGVSRVYTLTFTESMSGGGYGDVGVAPLGVLTILSVFFTGGMTPSAVATAVAGALVAEIGSDYSIVAVDAVVTITTILPSENDILFGAYLEHPDIADVLHSVTVAGSFPALIRPGDYFQYPIQLLPDDAPDVRLFRCTRRSFDPTGEVTISGQMETNGAVGAVTANPVVEDVSTVVPPLYYRRIISLHPETIDDPQPIGLLAARPGNLVLGVDVKFDTSPVGDFSSIGRQDGFALPMSLAASLNDSALTVQLKLLPLTLGRNPQRDKSILEWDGGTVESTDDQLLLVMVKKDAGGALLTSGSDQWVEIMSVSGHPSLSGDIYTVPVLRGRRGTAAKAFSTGTFPNDWVDYEAWLIPRIKLVAMSVVELAGLIGNPTGGYFRYVPYERGLTYDPVSAFAEYVRLGGAPYAEFVNQGDATHQPQDNVVLPAVSQAALVAAKNAYSVILSNEAHTVACDAAGNALGGQLGSGSPAFTTVSVYRGDTALTAVASSPTYNQFALGTPTASAGTASNPTISTVRCDTLTANTGTITIPVTIGGVGIINRIFTLSKAKAGSAGSSPGFTDYVFTRSATTPATPTATSGTPPGWYDGPPAAVAGQLLWMSTADKTYAGVLIGAWSTPVSIDATAEYSVDGTTSWHAVFTPGDIYMRINGSAAMRIIGEIGLTGTRGSKSFYVATTSTSWVDAEANAGIVTASFVKVLLDTVTLYKSSAPTFSETRYWDGSDWQPVAQVIDGNLIVHGTVGTNHLVASIGITTPTINGGTIKLAPATGAALICSTTVITSDDANVRMNGGGGSGPTRGAQIDVFGNNHASASGEVIIAAGNATSGAIRMLDKSAVERFQLHASGIIVTGTLAASGIVSGTGYSGGTINCTTGEFSGALTALTLASTSARRFKKKIRGMKGALATVKQLRGVDFQWRDRKKGFDDFGLIAEEVGAVLPSAVAYGPDGQVSGVQYGKLTALLIEAVKTLSAEIDELKSKRDGQRN